MRPPLGPPRPESLRVVSLNVRSWAANGVEVLAQAGRLGVDVLLLQETHLRPGDAVVAPGWQVLRRDREIPVRAGEAVRGGGLLTLVRRGLTAGASLVPLGEGTALERLDVSVGRPGLPAVQLVSLYRPPLGPVARDSRPRGLPLAELPCGPQVVLAGDLNAHHASWDAWVPEDAHGRALREWLDAEGMAVWNEPGTATRHTVDPVVGGSWLAVATVRELRRRARALGIPPSFVRRVTAAPGVAGRTASTATRAQLVDVVRQWSEDYDDGGADGSECDTEGESAEGVVVRERRSAPDVVVSAATWARDSWRVLDRWGSSDHLPMLFEVPAGGERPVVKRWREVRCWDECDWPALLGWLERSAPKVLRQRRCEEAAAMFARHVRRAVEMAVPLRRVRCREGAKPWWDDELVPLLDERDVAWRALRRLGDAAGHSDWERWRAARDAARDAVEARKRDWLGALVAACDADASPGDMFRALRVVEGGQSAPQSPPLLVGGEFCYGDAEKAEALAAAFAEVRQRPPVPGDAWRAELRNAPTGSGMDDAANGAFTASELGGVLDALDVSKGDGPDGVRNAVLRGMPEVSVTTGQ